MEDEEKIGEIAAAYFRELFESSSPSNGSIEEVLVGVSPRVSREQNLELSKPFTKGEIEAALKNINPSKAPVLTKFMLCSIKSFGRLSERILPKFVLTF